MGIYQTCQTTKSHNPTQIAFLFSGQGCHYPGMAGDLYRHSRVFRHHFDRCSNLFLTYLDVSLSHVLYGEDGQHLLARTDVVQAVIFTTQYALVRYWRSLGIRPSCVIGHSIGEYAAACAAGVFSLSQGVAMVALRGQAMQSSSSGIGRMAGVLASKAQVEALCEHLPGVWVAAVNAPQNVTVAGRAEAVEALLAAARKARLFTERLPMSHASHSPMMQDSANELAAGLQGVRFHAPRIRLYSTLSGHQVNRASEMDETYWSGHLSRPVLFFDAVGRAVADGACQFIEIGGTATLCGLVAQMSGLEGAVVTPSLRQGKDDLAQIGQSLALLHQAGIPLDMQKYHEIEAATVPPQAQEEEWDEGAELDTLTNHLLALFNEIRGEDAAKLVLHSPLLEQGMDSLMLVRFNNRLLQHYGLRITLSDYFSKINTPQRVIDYLWNSLTEDEHT